MSLSDNKITAAMIAAYGVQSQPNKLTGSALQNKQAFDKLVEKVVAEKLNGLIDALAAPGAAGELGVGALSGLDASTVQEAFEAILLAMQDMTQGSVADGSITAAKLAGDIRPIHVGIKMGTAEPTTALIGPGEIYLRYEA